METHDAWHHTWRARAWTVRLPVPFWGVLRYRDWRAPLTEHADVREEDWPYRLATARAFRVGLLPYAVVLGWWHRPSSEFISTTAGLMRALSGRMLDVNVIDIEQWPSWGTADMGLVDTEGVTVHRGDGKD